MSEQPPADETPVLRIVPMPADTNPHGTIFVGWVLSQIDLDVAVFAQRRPRPVPAAVAV